MATYRPCLLRDLANIQRWRIVICSRTAASFREITTCSRGSWKEPATVVRRRSTSAARFVTQSLMMVQPRGASAFGRTSARRMSTSSTVLKENNTERDSNAPVSKKSDEEYGSVLMRVLEEKKEPKELTTATKVVQAGKDLTYLFIVVGGFAVLAFLMYSVGSEFFTSNSPSSIFTKTLKRVKSDEKVKEVLGVPIVGHGEETGRGRRRFIDHMEYIKGGKECMVMKFHVSGKKRKGVVRLDLEKNDQGKYECKYLDVELVGYPPGTIVLENNYSLQYTL